jgi:HPt (histidine-containing phosphotransfer) domain-containing protein
MNRERDRRTGVAALQARLERRYASVLPERVADLRAALARARSDPDGLEPARELAHRLKGTAGSYGFAEVADGIARIETALLVAAPPDWSAIEETLDGVEQDAVAVSAGQDAGPVDDR